MAAGDLYDRIGGGYAEGRHEDPRIAAAVWRALGDAPTVINVGAGTGLYEPRDREVVAVEPSAVMRAQRPAGAAPAVDARAEALPFDDGAFDAAMAVLTDHHWADRAAGLRELRRVARDRVVVLTWDPAFRERFWLAAEYFADWPRPPVFSLAERARLVGATRVEVLPIPADCRDGFLHAHWARPQAYLDPRVQQATSPLRLLPADVLARGMARLREDLESGAWQARHGDLLALDELDCGYRLLVREP